MITALAMPSASAETSYSIDVAGQNYKIVLSNTVLRLPNGNLNPYATTKTPWWSQSDDRADAEAALTSLINDTNYSRAQDGSVTFAFYEFDDGFFAGRYANADEKTFRTVIAGTNKALYATVPVPEIDGAAMAQGVVVVSALALWGFGRRGAGSAGARAGRSPASGVAPAAVRASGG
ncbi:hypothetical protein V6X63_10190 [Spiribacter sp. 221]|uniref:hypothetical protein n=1 Tax=Spiribacter onubensis TaxID=3122420 RepID=UPI00349FA8D7